MYNVFIFYFWVLLFFVHNHILSEPSHDKNFDTHTHMILIKLIVCCSGYLMHHGELHLTAKIKIINR